MIKEAISLNQVLYPIYNLYSYKKDILGCFRNLIKTEETFNFLKKETNFYLK